MPLLVPSPIDRQQGMESLRDAQQRAVTEGNSVCVAFDLKDGDDNGGWTVSRGACGATYDQLGRDEVDRGGTALDSASFSSAIASCS